MKEVKIVLPLPDDVLPDEFVVHLLNATRELLLALRSLIDASVEKIDEVESSLKERREIQKIEIE